MNTKNLDTAKLQAILGETFWAFGFDTQSAATKTACLKIAAGRPALTFTNDGVHYAAWGLKVAA
jgi:hypothetical protein